MALIRCPTHGLTYNDENPRGCPACAADRKGRASQAAVMQELVKATKKADGGGGAPPKPDGPGWLDRLLSSVPSYDQRKVLQIGAAVIALLVVALVWLSRPKFVSEEYPPEFDATNARTFPVNTGQDVAVVLAILGTRNPSVHPTASSVERYSYGTGLYVDAIGARVYSITLGVPNRTWRGLRVGAGERETEGVLALLGHPIQGGEANPQPTPRGKYRTFPDGEVPIRTLTAEVRPPNGCFDVVVELQPRTLGYLHADARYAVVARNNDALNWVTTKITVVDRARSGPLNDRGC